MGKFYSMDLRERIVGHVRAGHSARAAARVFGVSPSMAIRYAAAARAGGDVTPKPQGRPAGLDRPTPAPQGVSEDLCSGRFVRH